MGYIGKEGSDKVGTEGKEGSKDNSKDGSSDKIELPIEDHKMLVDRSMDAYSDLYRPRADIRGPREIFSF